MVGHEALDLAAEVRILLPQPRLVYRIAYIVKNKALATKRRGFEADPNASSGGRMSGANDSEGGRTSKDERKRGGKKESSSPSQWRYRLGVRMDGSQPSDRGSNPRSATKKFCV